jgi:hypothetical protein
MTVASAKYDRWEKIVKLAPGAIDSHLCNLAAERLSIGRPLFEREDSDPRVGQLDERGAQVKMIWPPAASS